jgi:hypothetical protein
MAVISSYFGIWCVAQVVDLIAESFCILMLHC